MRIYRNAINIAGQIVIPTTDEDAKFSIHYSLATALLQGTFGLEDLSTGNMTADVRSVIEKIHLIEDETMENRAEGVRGAGVHLWMKDGAEFSDVVRIPRGDAAKPFSWDDIREKLRVCADGLLTAQQQNSLLTAVDEFEMMENYGTINALFA